MGVPKLTEPAAAKLKQQMQQHIQDNCLLTGQEFALAGGSATAYYFDCKKATLDGTFLNLLAEYVCDFIVPQLPRQPTLVGGLTLGADFLTAALAMYSSATGGSIKQGSIVRKEAKKHGTQSKIENELDGGQVLVVEDVITTGASIAKACDEFLAAGYEPIALLTIVEREAGGAAWLRENYNLEVYTLFTSSDFSLAVS